MTVSYRVGQNWLRAVRDLSFEVADRETLAIVGETGSGKSTAVSALLRLLPANSRTSAGAMAIGTQDVLKMSDAGLRRMRGTQVGYVTQQPMSSFNPTMTVGEQVAEPLVVHRKYTPRAALVEVRARLDEIGIHEVDRVVRAYPHQLSGGMLQRAMIAMATICGPRLLVADELTSALDVTVQRQIIELLRRLKRDYGLALLMVSHDLELVASIADRILVLYGGRAVEQGLTEEIMKRPRHPYTIGLLSSVTDVTAQRKTRLPSMPGYPPAAADVDREKGCPFRARCSRAVAVCAQQFPEAAGDSGHRWACHNPAPGGAEST